MAFRKKWEYQSAALQFERDLSPLTCFDVAKIWHEKLEILSVGYLLAENFNSGFKHQACIFVLYFPDFFWHPARGSISHVWWVHLSYALENKDDNGKPWKNNHLKMDLLLKMVIFELAMLVFKYFFQHACDEVFSRPCLMEQIRLFGEPCPRRWDVGFLWREPDFTVWPLLFTVKPMVLAT